MTTRTELEACQVTDADRRAANRWLTEEDDQPAPTLGNVLSLAIAFARHRIEAERAAMREAAEIAGSLGAGWGAEGTALLNAGHDHTSFAARSAAAQSISAAILSRIPSPPSSKDQSRWAKDAEIAELREALEPFAKAADEVDYQHERAGDAGDDDWLDFVTDLKCGDLRRARTALKDAPHVG